jgi:hypothetical protein
VNRHEDPRRQRLARDLLECFGRDPQRHQPFLAAARERDCTVHPDKPMLEAQIDLMIEFMGLTAKEER